MNIVAAAKSGKPFTLPDLGSCIIIGRSPGNPMVWECDGRLFEPNFDQLVSDLWEIKEEAVAITKTQFYQAIADLMKEAGMGFIDPLFGKRNPKPGDFSEFKEWKVLGERLGFK